MHIHLIRVVIIDNVKTLIRSTVTKHYNKIKYLKSYINTNIVSAALALDLVIVWWKFII